jgi:hypothetical protein
MSLPVNRKENEMSIDNGTTDVVPAQNQPKHEPRIFIFKESTAKNPDNFFPGFLLGCLAGAVAMLLWAPQSGKETRKQIQEKAIKLRDQTAATVESTMMQVRTMAGQVRDDISGRAKELKQQG